MSLLCHQTKTGEHRWKTHDPDSPLYRVRYCAACGLIPLPMYEHDDSDAIPKLRGRGCAVATGAPIRVSRDERVVALYDSEPFPINTRRCRYCFRDGFRTFLTREHLVPRSRGGRGEGNYGLSCLRCNQMKADLTDEEFMAWLLHGETDQIMHRGSMRAKFVRMETNGTRLVLLRERERNEEEAWVRRA